MATTYASAKEVQDFLVSNTRFDGNSVPEKATVEDRINEAEDRIDQRTGHAWRTVTVGDNANNEYEYHDIKGIWRWETGISIFLEQRKIRSLDASSGDTLEIWNGSSWIDYIANKTEDRNSGDYWLDYDQGILYVKNFGFFPRKKAVRVNYRFGERSVPHDIRKATIYLVAANLVETNDKSLIVGEGTDQVPLESKATKWRNQARKIIKSRTEQKAITIA